MKNSNIKEEIIINDEEEPVQAPGKKPEAGSSSKSPKKKQQQPEPKIKIEIITDDEDDIEQVPRYKPKAHNGSPNNSSKNDKHNDSTASDDHSYRARIEAILFHQTRRGELKFKVIWLPHNIEVWEDIDVVLQEKEGLKEYLYRIQRNHNRSFVNLIRRFPFVLQVLD